MPGVGCLFRPSPGRGLLVGSGQPEGRRRWLVVCSCRNVPGLLVHFGHVGRLAGHDFCFPGLGVGVPIFSVALIGGITLCLVLAQVLGSVAFNLSFLARRAWYLL